MAALTILPGSGALRLGLRPFLRLLAGLGLCLGGEALLAQEAATPNASLGQATLLYRELHGLKKLEAEVSGNSNVLMVIRMTSKREVPVEQLEVFIDAKSGPIPLHFAPDGSFLMLMSDALYAENPYVRANQPKGTMRLDWGFFVKGVHGLDQAANYRELIAPMEESRKLLATMGKHIPEMKNATVTAMKLFFKKEPPANITIKARKGAKNLPADARGMCLVPYDSALVRENPAVVMPSVPERIDFVLEGVR